MTNLKNKHLYFISPHLDDAALSAGGLIASLSVKNKITLINVFTKASDARPNLSVRKFLKNCSQKNPATLFDVRRLEDAAAFKKYDVEIINLGFTDALWRQVSHPSKLRSIVTKIIPEAGYVYPVFSLHAKSGRISNQDQQTINSLSKTLQSIIRSQNSVIFCPLGLGNHVDHLIVNKVVKSLFKNIIFWSDFPYNLSDSTGLTPSFVHTKDQDKRLVMIKSYKSQISLLFPKGVPTLPVESYYES